MQLGGIFINIPLSLTGWPHIRCNVDVPVRCTTLWESCRAGVLGLGHKMSNSFSFWFNGGTTRCSRRMRHSVGISFGTNRLTFGAGRWANYLHHRTTAKDPFFRCSKVFSRGALFFPPSPRQWNDFIRLWLIMIVCILNAEDSCICIPIARRGRVVVRGNRQKFSQRSSILPCWVRLELHAKVSRFDRFQATTSSRKLKCSNLSALAKNEHTGWQGVDGQRAIKFAQQ